LDGLLKVMARDGYAGSTITKIGQAAKLTPGLVHYHFQSKHEILTALIALLTARVAKRLESRLALAGTDPRLRLEAFVDAYVALGKDADPSAVAAWAVIGAEAVRAADVSALYSEAIGSALGQLRKLIGAALRAEGRETENAGAIAAAMMAMIEGAYRIHAGAPDVLPKGFAAPALRRTLHHLIDAEKRAR
jgi:TetR/AcrR family transcriptional repressor of bet genes